MPGTTDSTILTAADDRRRLLVVLHPVRRAAYRMVADCERMLEVLHDPDRRHWQDRVGEALVSARHLLAITTPVSTLTEVTVQQAMAVVAARMEGPRRRIIDAMGALLRLVPVGVDEELVLQDARAVRDMAVNLSVAGRLDTGPIAPVVPGSPGAAGGEARPRVLIADDEDAVRRVLERYLERIECDTVAVSNGADALARARQDAFDLIITDIDMPGLTGMELLRELKSDERTRGIPVIVISGQDDLSSVVACIEQGADDHIAKPYQPLLLRARVRSSIERKRLRDEERRDLRRVASLTAAAEAVEEGRYVAGSLAPLSVAGDALGRLARVFDRMMSGLQAREDRLHRRVAELRREMGEAGGRSGGPASVSDESPFASGEILAARYEVIGQLGKGGMGMVYHARDLELQEEVAVKVVRRDLVKGDPAIVDRLKSEIRLARRISHRNVVRAHDLGEWKSTYFITMEYVRGVTVEHLIDRRGRLSAESALAIGTQVAEALAVAHEQQIIHRDIKPANLLVDQQGVLKVMDFGIARMMEREDHHTLGGFIVGTPQYMAPEQLMGLTVDARADLFALGVVLYECLAGRPPFIADSPIGLIARITDQEAPRLAEFVPNVPARLASLIHQQLAMQPADRAESARWLAAQLSEIEPERRADPASLLDEIDFELVDVVP